MGSPAPSPVTVDVVTSVAVGSLATGDVDFEVVTTTVTIPGGSSSAVFDAVVYGDAWYDDGETFDVTLTGVSGPATLGGTLTTVVTIGDSGPAPTLTTRVVSGADASTGSGSQSVTADVSEGDATSKDVVLELALSRPAEHPTVVDVVVYPTSTATNGTDVDVLSTEGRNRGPFTIGGLVSTYNVSAVIYGETVVEGTEVFDFGLVATYGVSGVTSTSNASVSIVNDDFSPPPSSPSLPLVTMALSSLSTTEPTSLGGRRNVTITVVMDSAASTDVVVQVATRLRSGGYASADVDFESLMTSVAIPAGATSVDFDVVVLGDAWYDDNELFDVVLDGVSGPASLGSDTVTIVSIADSGPVPTLSVCLASAGACGGGTSVGATLSEGDSGEALLGLVLQASRPSERVVVLDVATGGDATLGVDAELRGESVSGSSVTFGPGAVMVNVDVAVLGDLMHERNETLELVFTPRDTSYLETLDVAVVIVNDDGLPELAWVFVDAVIDEGTAKDLTGTIGNVTLKLSRPMHSRVDVELDLVFPTDVQTRDESELSAADAFDVFGFARSPLGEPITHTVAQFAPGEVEKVVNVFVVGDDVVEPDELLHVVISSASDVGIATDAAVRLVLRDDDLVSTISGADLYRNRGDWWWIFILAMIVLLCCCCLCCFALVFFRENRERFDADKLPPPSTSSLSDEYSEPTMTILPLPPIPRAPGRTNDAVPAPRPRSRPSIAPLPPLRVISGGFLKDPSPEPPTAFAAGQVIPSPPNAIPVRQTNRRLSMPGVDGIPALPNARVTTKGLPLASRQALLVSAAERAEAQRRRVEMFAQDLTPPRATPDTDVVPGASNEAELFGASIGSLDLAVDSASHAQLPPIDSSSTIAASSSDSESVSSIDAPNFYAHVDPRRAQAMPMSPRRDEIDGTLKKLNELLHSPSSEIHLDRSRSYSREVRAFRRTRSRRRSTAASRDLSNPLRDLSCSRPSRDPSLETLRRVGSLASPRSLATIQTRPRQHQAPISSAQVTVAASSSSSDTMRIVSNRVSHPSPSRSRSRSRNVSATRLSQLRLDSAGPSRSPIPIMPPMAALGRSTSMPFGMLAKARAVAAANPAVPTISDVSSDDSSEGDMMRIVSTRVTYSRSPSRSRSRVRAANARLRPMPTAASPFTRSPSTPSAGPPKATVARRKRRASGDAGRPVPRFISASSSSSSSGDNMRIISSRVTYQPSSRSRSRSRTPSAEPAALIIASVPSADALDNSTSSVLSSSDPDTMRVLSTRISSPRTNSTVTGCGTNTVNFDNISVPTSPAVNYPLASRSGSSIVFVGDVNGDGVNDMAFGSPLDDLTFGTVTIVFLNSDGSASSSVVHNRLTPQLSGIIAGVAGKYGSALAAPGDLNGDGVPDLLVGAPTLGLTGKAIVVFLASDGSISGTSVIENSSGLGLSTILVGELFGSAMAVIEGVPGVNYATHTMVAIGLAAGKDRGVIPLVYGSILIAKLSRSDGSVVSYTLLDQSQPGLNVLAVDGGFGSAIAAGDLRGTGSPVIAVGAPLHNLLYGRVYLLEMDWSTTSVTNVVVVEDGAIGWNPSPSLGLISQIGAAVAMADINNDGCLDLVVGAPGAPDIGPNYGVVSVLLLDAGPATLSVQTEVRLSYSTVPLLQLPISIGAELGYALHAGELNGNGCVDLLIGAPASELESGRVFVAQCQHVTRPIVWNHAPSASHVGGGKAMVLSTASTAVDFTLAGTVMVEVAVYDSPESTSPRYVAVPATVNSAGEIAFVSPPSAKVGYTQVRIVVDDDGSGQSKRYWVNNSMYYVDDAECTQPGFVLRDGVCRDCADFPGAVCPGGDRLWSQPGYWNADDDTPPTRCPVPEDCPGFSIGASLPPGVNSGGETESDSAGAAGFGSASHTSCIEGRTGFGCTACATDYYISSSGSCISCGSSAMRLVLIIFLIVFCIITAAVLACASRRSAGIFVALVIAVQLVALIIRYMIILVPAKNTSAFWIFVIKWSGIVLFDPELFALSCASPWSGPYFVVLYSLLVLVFLIMLIIAAIIATCRHSRVQNKAADDLEISIPLWAAGDASFPTGISASTSLLFRQDTSTTTLARQNTTASVFRYDSSSSLTSSRASTPRDRSQRASSAARSSGASSSSESTAATSSSTPSSEPDTMVSEWVEDMPNTVARRSWIAYGLGFMAAVFYTPMAYRTAAGLGCSTLADGVSRLDHEIATECYAGSHKTAAILLLWPIAVAYVAGFPLAVLIRAIAVARKSSTSSNDAHLPSDALRFNLFLIREGLRFLSAGLFTAWAPVAAVPFFLVLTISVVSAVIKDSLNLEVFITALAICLSLAITAWASISRWRVAIAAIAAIAAAIFLIAITASAISGGTVAVCVIVFIAASVIAIRFALLRSSNTESSAPREDNYSASFNG
ncbi:uncharacterized protein AMSG_12278 [Thecamonas trahens ATCC 50062]|uniref:Calx-beta domain-containing protein n=1 Tax=Thecamonas trahens ATCC 50062 TaxID=461836 RepID=A0A0L0DP02_THETB|nr:hypothetical protein AMSG_12278 [Thecamonas trahens ATCC 50062]KNC53995.1 hypothetical protein AMSG_12278 [Thecamonas trahens ATCC 50062]|eukprot:XP_013754205.1 hypothetical protein AMSG_12278 [Thecamonas trahens ATCC 50062]